MQDLRFTLLSDGSSDRAILPLLRRLLEEHCQEVALEGAWADLVRLPEPPRDLAKRIGRAVELYPCRLLFVHRDAEAQSPEQRRREIREALRQAAKAGVTVPAAVCVIPVRMQEAWLLVDEHAVRKAAGNPNGHEELELPPRSRLEDLPDPKEILHEALKQASGLSGVRRKKFPVHARVHRIADFIGDLSDLRGLLAFQRLEQDLISQLQKLGSGT